MAAAAPSAAAAAPAKTSHRGGDEMGWHADDEGPVKI